MIWFILDSVHESDLISVVVKRFLLYLRQKSGYDNGHRIRI